MAPLEKAKNQSDHFPRITGKITWSPYTIINGESQTLLLRFLLRGGGGCTQANRRRSLMRTPLAAGIDGRRLYSQASVHTAKKIQFFNLPVGKSGTVINLIHSDKELMLKTSAFSIFLWWSLYLINLVDSKLYCFTSPSKQQYRILTQFNKKFQM